MSNKDNIAAATDSIETDSANLESKESSAPFEPTLTYYECTKASLDPETHAMRVTFKCRDAACTSRECYRESAPEQMSIFRCVVCLKTWEVATGGAFRG